MTLSVPEIGDVAPDFTAEGTGGRTYSLSEYRGAPVVLVFYPGDATPVCTEQLRSYSAGFADFRDLNTEVLALSPQDVESHEAFAAEHSFPFPLLYDKDKRIGEQYGVVGPLGFYRRSIVAIDADGVICYAKRSSAGLGYVKSEQLLEILRDLHAATKP